LPKTDAAVADADAPVEAPAAPVKKSRYAARSKLPKAPKPTGPQLDTFAPAPIAPAEVADQQTQSAPLGLAGDTTKKKKKKPTGANSGDKTRIQERPKDTTPKEPVEITPAAPAKGAPAPAPIQQPAPVPQSAPANTPASPDPPAQTPGVPPSK
jgi:peptidyl-prolyl cis-trans isomerase SurA